MLRHYIMRRQDTEGYFYIRRASTLYIYISVFVPAISLVLESFNYVLSKSTIHHAASATSLGEARQLRTTPSRSKHCIILKYLTAGFVQLDALQLASNGGGSRDPVHILLQHTHVRKSLTIIPIPDVHEWDPRIYSQRQEMRTSCVQRCEYLVREGLDLLLRFKTATYNGVAAVVRVIVIIAVEVYKVDEKAETTQVRQCFQAMLSVHQPRQRVLTSV